MMASKHTTGLVVQCYGDVMNAIKFDSIEFFAPFPSFFLLLRLSRLVFTLNIYFGNAVRKANIINVHGVAKQ